MSMMKPDLNLGPLAAQRAADGVDLYIDLISMHDTITTGQFVRMRVTDEVLSRLAVMRKACIDFSFNAVEIVMAPKSWDETGDVDVNNWYVAQGTTGFNFQGTSLTSDATVETHRIDLSRLCRALDVAEGHCENSARAGKEGQDEFHVHGGAIFYSGQDVQFVIDAVTAKSREFVAQKLATDMAGAIAAGTESSATPANKTKRRRVKV